VTAIDEALINDIMRRAILTAGPSLVGYILSTRAGDFAQANTIAFASIIGNQLAQTYEAGHLENQLSPPVLKAMLGSLGILGVVLIIPPLRNLLQLALPTPLSWALISVSALSTGGLSRLTTSSKSNDAPEK
jgi:cation-transporting P-type ATPase I